MEWESSTSPALERKDEPLGDVPAGALGEPLPDLGDAAIFKLPLGDALLAALGECDP